MDSVDAAPQDALPAATDAPHSDENKFQKAVAAWRTIDLTALIPNLDSAASDLVAHQRDALVQRKDLAQKTKDFRKLDDAAKLSEVKGLLKAYQTYIDLITNQSKAIHSAFLQVYSPLAEAPDPYPLLEASIDSLVIAEETVPKLTDENEQLRKQASKLASQLEDTEAKLEQERKAKQEIERTRDEKIKAAESSWGAVLTEKQDNWDSKEKALEEKIENQDRLIKEIKASYEVSQRLNSGDGQSAGNSSAGVTAAELEIVHAELDRANVRLAEVEARNEKLRLELAQSTSHAETKDEIIEDSPAFLRLQSENTSLLRRLDTARLDKDSDKRRWQGEVKGLEREVESLKNDRNSLKQRLNRWSDYENIKQELQVLKSIEFATGDDDQETDSLAGSELELGSKGASGKKESLEQLLLSRNKKLSNELTLLRVSHQDMQSKLETLQDELSNANMELEKSRSLTATLENDLERIQQEAANNFPSSAMSIAGTYTSRYPHSSYKSARAGRSTSPTSSIISGFDPSMGSGSTDSLRQGEGSGSSILPMVTAQRDRFKKKITELEAELQKSYQTVQSLRSEVAALQKDNITLYEKTRYVSTYSRSSSSAAHAATSNPAVIQVTNNDNTEPTLHRYHSAYEAKISPFSAFRSRESTRALRRMTLPERAIFQIARMVLATRISRNLFAMYCMALHLLVIAMMFHFGEPHGPRLVKPNVAGPLPADARDKIKLPNPKFR